jgi:hypothetical protein
VALQHASDDPDLVRPRSVWERKLLAFDPVDDAGPVGCRP